MTYPPFDGAHASTPDDDPEATRERIVPPPGLRAPTADELLMQVWGMVGSADPAELEATSNASETEWRGWHSDMEEWLRARAESRGHRPDHDSLRRIEQAVTVTNGIVKRLHRAAAYAAAAIVADEDHGPNGEPTKLAQKKALGSLRELAAVADDDPEGER